MATGVVFGVPKSLLLQPGAYTTVDARGLQVAPPFAFNTVCVMGAALGGEPLVPYLFNDPLQAAALFGAQTPLAEAIRLAFKGGVNGGASTVIGVRVDNTAQAKGALSDDNSGVAMSAVFDDHGAYGNTFTVSFFPGSTQGTMGVVSGVSLDGTPYQLKLDNQSSFSQLVNLINERSPVSIKLTAGGTKATQTIVIATSQEDGRAALTETQGAVLTTTAYLYQYPEEVLPNSSSSFLASFDYADPLEWAIASTDSTARTFTTVAANELAAGDRVQITGTDTGNNFQSGVDYVVFAKPAADTAQLAPFLAVPAGHTIQAIDALTDTITLAAAGPADGDIVEVSGTTLPGGVSRNRLYFVVNTAGADVQISTEPGGAAVELTDTFQSAQVVVVARSTSPALSGTFSDDLTLLRVFGLVSISSAIPESLMGSYQHSKTVPASSQSLTNVTITASAYTSDSARFQLSGAQEWGFIDGGGAPGTVFTVSNPSADSELEPGQYQILHYEFDGLGADQTRIVRKLGGDRTIRAESLSFDAAFYPGLAFEKTQPAEAIESQLPANGLLPKGGHYLAVIAGDTSINYNTQIGDTVMEVGNEVAGQFNALDSSPVVARSSYDPVNFASTITLEAKEPGIGYNGLRINALVNVNTELLITAQGITLSGGVDPNPPRTNQGTIAGTMTFNGGYDSAPTYQRWLDGLDVVKYVPLRSIVPAGTDDIGVQMAIADHVTLMSGTAKRRERYCVLGHGRGWTEEQVRERGEMFNNPRVVFCSPGITLPDGLNGLPRFYPAYYFAAMVAGMLAAEGNGISDPITHTYLRDVIGVEKNYQAGSTELDQLIESGCLTLGRDPALTRPSRGWRINRAITTYRVTQVQGFQSSAFESISILNQSDFIAADVRELEESLFIGTSTLPETFAAVRAAVNRRLKQRSEESLIYGYDPEFTQVTPSSDNPKALLVAYKIYPTPDLEFILNTQILAPIPAVV